MVLKTESIIVSRYGALLPLSFVHYIVPSILTVSFLISKAQGRFRPLIAFTLIMRDYNTNNNDAEAEVEVNALNDKKLS